MDQQQRRIGDWHFGDIDEHPENSGPGFENFPVWRVGREFDAIYDLWVGTVVDLECCFVHPLRRFRVQQNCVEAEAVMQVFRDVLLVHGKLVTVTGDEELPNLLKG